MDRQTDQALFHSNPSNVSADHDPLQQDRPHGTVAQSREAGRALSVAIASTFTADLLCAPLNFWMQTLCITANVVLAPYAQVMQELLSPRSLLSQNVDGFNILVIRLEDWIRDKHDNGSAEQNLDHIRRVANDFAAAVQGLHHRSSASILVYLCPPSFAAKVPHVVLTQIEGQLRAQLDSLPRIQCWSHADLQQLYPLAEYEDSRANRIGHIPYTNEYFIAIATSMARRIAAVVKPQPKVIAIDCDNTLWSGICGEDGATGVELTSAHLKFQKMLVRQHNAGILLCLCSKNNASDVEAVIRGRSDMPLREEHLISSRVNWIAKSSNLNSLAQELDLSLDSFIFIDDDPVECAEVRAHCPSVLTLQFPRVANEIAHFVDHIWAFDRFASTQDATRRTAQYRENRARKIALQQTSDLMNFLASLQLQVIVSPLQVEQLGRVAELVQRTNQFNLANIRRSSSEIEALWKSGSMSILVAHARDRFGDYGLVGALIFRTDHGIIDVDTFVLSCRALGRGVEHRIVNELGRIARKVELNEIRLRYRPTSRNQPAREFLERSFSVFQVLPKLSEESVEEAVFSIPIEYAERLTIESSMGKLGSDKSKLAEVSTRVDAGSSSEWHEATYRLSRLSDIVREITQQDARQRHSRAEYLAPRTPTEAAVTEICTEVLGLKEIGVSDDFFEIGGDSVQAVRVISRIASVLGLELSLHEFFEASKIEEVAARLASASVSSSRIHRTDRTRPLPLSSAQQRLWFIDQLESGSTAYHIAVGIRMRGALDRMTLQMALDELIVRHEALRTTFVIVDGKPEQVVTSEASFSLPFLDLRMHEAEWREVNVLKCAEVEAAAPFDLSTGPLIRGKLLQLSDDEHVLLLTMHHMISDGWSVGVLIRDLGVLYCAHREGRQNPLPPLPIQYIDYARWQQQCLKEPRFNEHLAYWKAHLQGAPQRLELPTDRPRPAVQSYRGEKIGVFIDSDLTADLRALSRRFNLTLAMTLCAAWYIVLSKISGHEDIVVGMPVANRRRTELEELVGFFVNTLALRIRLEDSCQVSDLLRHVKESMLRAQIHQDVPFEQVVEALEPVRSRSYSPLFQVMLVLQNAPHAPRELSGLSLTEQEIPSHTAQFDLLLSLHDSGTDIRGYLNYASDLFDHTTMTRWVGYFKTVLAQIARKPQTEIGALQMMSVDERHRIINSFNETEALYPQETLIHELFEEQVRRTPNAVAVAYEESRLTYAELNREANQLAWHLRSRGIGPDQLVGICVERSLLMVVGLLGILKAGGAYVPMDPNYPAERLNYMLKDATPRVVLSQKHLLKILPATAAEIVALDAEWPLISTQRGDNLTPSAIGLRPHNLAYVIYTSGSTGQPKGAMNEHRALINRLQWMQDRYQLCTSDRVLQKTPFSFDVSVWEFFWPLMVGARLVVARPDGHKDADYLKTVIESTGVTTLHFVPSMLQTFLHRIEAGRCSSVRRIVCSGEELSAMLQNKCLECMPQAGLSNLYGPTEAAIDVTAWECQWDKNAAKVPIGRPIANVQMYVLDKHLEPVPIGVAGELYIGGVGVGRGYLNRRELTFERFIPDPFSANFAARLYRTGDLGHWRADGVIEYLGRNDHQIKIRGFRIELGEIEAHLRSCPQVKDVVVLAREDLLGDQRLVAYVVPTSPHQPESGPIAETLRAHLKMTVPEYMVPGAFVMLGEMPLSPNGKLDRRALPAPQLDAYTSRRYEAPQGDVEEVLVGIWQALLHRERIGRHDNFFELGGHSLLIAQMLGSLRNAGLSTHLHCVFENPTLSALAKELTQTVTEEVPVPPSTIPEDCELVTPRMLPLVRLEQHHIDYIARTIPGGTANIQDIYPLTALQEGLLFHHLLNQIAGDVYVVPTLLLVSSRERLQDLILALQTLIDRHDVFRTAVLWEHLPRPVQVVYRRATLRVEQTALDPGRDSREQVGEWLKAEQQVLDLQYAPLLQMRVAADPHSPQFYVLLRQHHIIGDNRSREMAIAEVSAQLESRARKLADPIPYRNHVVQVLASERTRNSEAFFDRKLGDVDEPTAPFGLLDVHRDGSHAAEAHEEFDVPLARQVRTEARRLSVSVATLFHAAWALVVAHTSGRDDVIFGTVLLGRLQGTTASQRMLGLFINTLPIRLRLRRVTVIELVTQTQRELIELLQHDQASLAEAQRCTRIVGSGAPFSTLLNYRHYIPEFDTKWSSAGGIEVLAAPERTNYPIALSIDDLGEGFSLSAVTDRRINPGRITGYMHAVMRSLVEALEKAPGTSALALSILPESELCEVIGSFNATTMPFRQGKLIHELFEEQVERAPQAVALTCGDSQITYDALNRKANKIACALLARGVKTDDRIGVYLDRNIEMIAVLLGVLKAGAAYVPLDVTYPMERLTYVLTDAAPRVVITQKMAKRILSWPESWVLALDADKAEIDSQPDTNPVAESLGLSQTHLAYVIYTSGSTGAPKGVMVEHHSLVNLAQWHCAAFDVHSGSRTSCVAAIGFDATVWEIWPTLSVGATLVLAPQQISGELSELVTWWAAESLDVSFLPTPVAELAFSRNIRNATLRTLLVGGDRLRHRPLHEPYSLVNNYGPTEATVVATSGQLCDDDDVLHIGRPISNGQIYVLDSRRQPVPVGVTGEIYVGGAGVARGYLNRPELTAERFISDPFSADIQARMYRTGDLGRWRADGLIEYLGRNDHQVKIRGFRIELGEIESQLAKHDQVKEAVVDAREDIPGETRLVAYVVPKNLGTTATPTAEALRAHLKAALPAHMIPGAFVTVESFPLTPHGKLDRRALPSPGMGAYASRCYDAPKEGTEQTLAKIWQELLRIDRVGRVDNFFELGGHSLLAMASLVKINEAFGIALRVADIYQNPTLQELAARISGCVATDELVDIQREASLVGSIVAAPGSVCAPARAILLTGGAGFVGRFLLNQLLRDSDATIYCIVRDQLGINPSARLREKLLIEELWHEEFAPRVITVPGDLRLSRFGIDETMYKILCHEVDSIYHCATSMNHLESYAMAKRTNVDSAKELLDLAACGKPKLLNYISTLGVFSSPGSNVTRVVDELTPIDDEEHLNSHGYTASKWIAEKIFMKAQAKGIPCNIFRLGLVWADSREGRFDEFQQVYRILKSSLLMGFGIKDYRCILPPTPVDYVARSVVLLAGQHSNGAGIFHISADKQMDRGIFERYNEIADTALDLLPIYEWICELKRLHHRGRSLPAVPLMEFAFSMTEEAFEKNQLSNQLSSIHFDCARTHRELERSGIVAPPFDNDLLRVCIERMFSRDTERKSFHNRINETSRTAYAGSRERRDQLHEQKRRH